MFFSGWKQEALFTLSAWLSHMLSTLAAQQGALLSYIPTCYTDAIVDFMKLLLKANNRFATVRELPELECKWFPEAKVLFFRLPFRILCMYVRVPTGAWLKLSCAQQC